MEINYKVLKEMNYSKVLEGISIASGSRVFVKGERTIELEDGRIISQYIYDIDGVTPQNLQPFVALKANIILA